MDLAQKKANLVANLQKMNKVAIAYSGGIDSTLLLKVAMDTLGTDNVLAVVVNSELFSNDEFNKAIELADQMGAQVLGLEMSELSDPKIVANTPESWYYSKKMLYSTIKKAVAERGFDVVADGMIADDNNDFRPGLKARDEANILSPLQTVNMYKSEVRELAHEMNITNWNKVASCSVASRFPYFTKLDLESVNRVFASEKFLRNMGYATVRVRVHHDLARIELPVSDLNSAWENKDKISAQLKKFGFNYVTIDLDGFTSGRMNNVIANKEQYLNK